MMLMMILSAWRQRGRRRWWWRRCLGLEVDARLALNLLVRDDVELAAGV
jgi:hypothetical protein